MEELSGRRILAAMNLRSKKIGSFVSEVLVKGAKDENGHVVLLEPDTDIQNGEKLVKGACSQYYILVIYKCGIR